MQAIMIKDEYPDLNPLVEYEIESVLINPRRYITLKNNRRKYIGSCFKILHNGEEISFAKAHRIYQFGSC